MDFSRASAFVDKQWPGIVERLQAYVRIPAKSPLFDPDWEKNGHIEAAITLIADWCRTQPIPGMRVEVRRLPGLTPIVVTTSVGARRLRGASRDDGRVSVLVVGEESIDSSGLIRAHERLFNELGVRYVDCEGGAVILEALHQADILDEIFVTVTDVDIDPGAHAGIKRISSLDGGRARLIAESRTDSDAGYRFQRWRFNDRS